MIRQAESPAPVDRSWAQRVLPPADAELLSEFMGCLAHLGPPQPGHGSLIGMIGSRAGEGVTTVCQGLVRSAEASGRSALLVPRHFDGLPRWLCSSRSEPAGALADSHCLTALSQRDSLPSAVESSEDSEGTELLSNEDLQAWLRRLRSAYDYTFFDLPPINLGLQPLTSRLDGVVVVVAAPCTDREAVRRAVDHLQVSGIPVLGTVLNKRRRYIPDWLYRLV